MNIKYIDGITKYGYPQGKEGRKGLKPTAVCVHVIEGTINSATNWFKNPISTTSYNYGVGKDGSIVCWVKDENASWANGKIQKPTWKGLIKSASGGYINPNLHTISISREGYSHNIMLEEQRNSLIWLIRNMLNKYNLQPSRKTVIGHYEIDSVGKPNCPGKLNLDVLVKEILSLPSGGGDKPLELF